MTTMGAGATVKGVGEEIQRALRAVTTTPKTACEISSTREGGHSPKRSIPTFGHPSPPGRWKRSPQFTMTSWPDSIPTAPAATPRGLSAS